MGVVMETRWSIKEKEGILELVEDVFSMFCSPPFPLSTNQTRCNPILEKVSRSSRYCY